MSHNTSQMHIAGVHSPLTKTNKGISIAGQATRSKPNSLQPNSKDKQPKYQEARNNDNASCSPKISMSLSGQPIKGQSHKRNRELRTDSSNNAQSGTSIKGQAKGSAETKSGQIQIKERASKHTMHNEGDSKLAQYKRPKKGAHYGSMVEIVGSAASKVPAVTQQEAVVQPAMKIAISGRTLKKREDSLADKRERTRYKRRSLFGYQMNRVLRKEQARDTKGRERRVSDPAATTTSDSCSSVVATSKQPYQTQPSKFKPEAISMPIEVLGINKKATEKQQRHVVTRGIAVHTDEPPVKMEAEQGSTQCKDEQSDIELNATIDF